jgi:ribosomal protein S18 acetylase RimI-like enzyme
MSTQDVRPATLDDFPAIRAIAIDTGLFGAEDWPDVESIAMDSVNGEMPDHMWIVLDGPDGVAGAAYYAPEPFAHRMWNLYFLGVAPARQGSGVGGTLVRHVESVLRGRGESVLLIETSGTDKYAATRDFYLKLGYDLEARIRDFYGLGDDKVVFWKSLT